MKKRGFELTEIVAKLHDKGIEVKPQTLAKYLAEARRQKETRKTKNRPPTHIAPRRPQRGTPHLYDSKTVYSYAEDGLSQCGTTGGRHSPRDWRDGSIYRMADSSSGRIRFWMNCKLDAEQSGTIFTPPFERIALSGGIFYNLLR